MKTCFKCNIEKPLNLFYKHPKMGDGHLGKCIECTKSDSESRRHILSTTSPEWVIKEAERQRQKEKRRYHEKLKFSEHHKEKRRGFGKKYRTAYPEKKGAYMAVNKIKTGEFHKHHWSYNKDHWKDVILLKPQHHTYIHRFIKYDSISKMYISIEGELLNTKLKHEKYIIQLLKKWK